MGDQKTNNLCEGFNHGFKLSVPANASDWAIIDRFKAEESMAKQSLFQAAVGNLGPDTNKSRNHARKDKEAQLKHLVSNYSHMTIDTYLDALITFFD
jgi:hypothetical protein